MLTVGPAAVNTVWSEIVKQEPTVTLCTEQRRWIAVYTVYDINDCLVIVTTSWQLARRYFDLAQKYGTVARVAAVERYLDTRRPRRL